MTRDTKRLYFVLSLIGANSICSQIILIREVIAVFSGNELTMGFVLASWFLWVALGSFIGGRWVIGQGKELHNRFALLQAAIPFILILQVLLIRQSRGILGLQQMAMVGLTHIFLVTILFLAPLCIILGMMFSLGYQWQLLPDISPASRVGYVYVLEAIGSGVGGALFTFLLIRIMSHIQICLLLGMLNILSASIIVHMKPTRQRAQVFILNILLLLFFMLFLLSLFWKLDLMLFTFQWKNFHIIACEDSIFGRVALTKMDGEYTLYEHGVLTGALPDPWRAEWTTHLPLIQHPHPKKALFVGTGIESLKEGFKHGLVDIDYLEIDPLSLLLLEHYLPRSLSAPLMDKRVNPVYRDVRLFLREMNNRYDVIILGLPDPKTAQLNRMYTQEFFEILSSRLTKEGIIGFSVTSSENYIGPSLADYLKCIFKTVREVFPAVLVTPGDKAYFIARKEGGALTLDHRIIAERLRDRGIFTLFFSEAYLPSHLSEERVDTLNEILKDAKGVWTNRDLRPVCYYYDLMLWGRYFSPAIGKVLKRAKEIDRVSALLVFLIALIPFILLRLTGKARSRRITVGLVVLFGGFIEIVIEFLLILGFQVFYGYAYLQLGILIAAFMVGLAIGSALMTSVLDRLARAYRVYIVIQALYIIYPLSLIALLKSFNLLLWPPFVMAFLFPFSALIAGLIGGLQFPVATRLFLTPNKRWKGQAGLLYGLDLAGSALGAVLVSSYFVPLYGIPTTLFFSSILGLTGLVLLIANS